jgi:hypothetical protein
MATTLVAQKAFDWIRPGYELVTVKLEWNVQVPFLNTTDGEGETLESPLFSPEETPNSKWQLQVGDGSHSLRIYACHCTSTAGGYSNFVEPALVEMLIRNNRRQKVFQKMVSSAPTISHVEFAYSKLDLVKCQQSDGSLTLRCKILTHECENYLLSQMSPDNCIVLLLHGDLQNPAEPLKEAAKFFRRFPSQVMATDGWKKIEKENPAVLCEILEFLHRKK